MGRTSSSQRLGWALTAQGRKRLDENGDRKGKGPARGSRDGGGTTEPGFFKLTHKRPAAHGLLTEMGTPGVPLATAHIPLHPIGGPHC